MHYRRTKRERLQRGLCGIALATALLLAALASLAACSPVSYSNSYTGSNSSSYASTAGLPATLKESAAGGSVTIMVYMNGSNLESDDGMASADIQEMLDSGAGQNVNTVIQTMGTRQWRSFGVASDRSQRYVVEQGNLMLVDDSLGQLDCTDKQTLADFISWSKKNYPADRYMLVFWDHGAGPVYGFGYDELNEDVSAALTLDEIQWALQENSDVNFDIIGMDCCIMSSLETCWVLQPYCNYSVLSEDFESGYGWNYTNWMKSLEQNPSMGSVDLGSLLVKETVAANQQLGQPATFALIDESKIGDLFQAWTDFAYANTETLTNQNYSQETESSSRASLSKRILRPNGYSDWYYGDGGYSDWYYGYNDYFDTGSDWYGPGASDLYGPDYYNGYGQDEGTVTLSDYYVTDILSVASSIDSAESTALAKALNAALSYYECTTDETGMADMAVTLPYGDSYFYSDLQNVFGTCGMDSSYIEWLGNFVNAGGADNYYNFDDFYNMFDYYYGQQGYDGSYWGSTLDQLLYLLGI